MTAAAALAESAARADLDLLLTYRLRNGQVSEQYMPLAAPRYRCTASTWCHLLTASDSAAGYGNHVNKAWCSGPTTSLAPNAPCPNAPCPMLPACHAPRCAVLCHALPWCAVQVEVGEVPCSGGSGASASAVLGSALKGSMDDALLLHVRLVQGLNEGVREQGAERVSSGATADRDLDLFLTLDLDRRALGTLGG